jgi:putative peptide zinc metalloprotease protein
VTTDAVTTGPATPELADSKQAGLQRAEGVELIGEMAGSGYRVPPSLARRRDGQTIQLSPLLYALLREIDGRCTPAELSAAVSSSTGRSVSEENVCALVDQKLRPLGLLVNADGSQPTLKKRNPLLGIRFRYAVTDPDRTRRLTDPFQFLFRSWVAVPLLVAFGAVCWWVFFHKGLASAAYDAFERPGLLILVFVVTVVSAGFHEFGHAAAARYGGATPGVMGVGLYLVWPAFYTDVTDSYRLGRRGRLRTDLGGLYFNAIVAVAITGLWLGLRYDALLLVVATQILQMLRQLAPMVRFDGYHVLADLTGVPDLYGRIKPALLGVLPWRWGDPQARLLKPCARIVVTLWVVVVVPLLLSALWMAVVALPRLLGTAWASLGKQQDVLSAAWTDGDMIQATARVLAMAAILITVAGTLYMVTRFARRSVAVAWQGTANKPVMRMLAGVLGAAVLAAIAYAWWPNDDNYRPIQPSERGTIGDIVYALKTESISQPRTVIDTPRPAATSRALAPGQRGVMHALWDTRTAPPTKASPQLALVLVPTAPPGATVGGGGGFITAATPTTKADQGWVFPVDKPLAPEEGDTQALAVNTTDNTVEYQAALAMVYVDDGSDAMNVNEAQAYASCDSCSAVAIAYQVVIVIDTDDTDDNVAVPQNLAGALNYNCVNCMTYALAQQLFVTVDEPLTVEQKAQLDRVWAEMQAYEVEIEKEKTPPGQVAAQLDLYTARVLDILDVEQTEATAAATASQTVPPSSDSQPPSPPTGATAAPPSSEPTATTDPTPATSSAGSTSTDPTGTSSDSAGTNASVAKTPDGSSSTAPTAPSESTAGGSTSTDPTSGGTTSGASATDGSTSDGTTSGGTTSP